MSQEQDQPEEVGREVGIAVTVKVYLGDSFEVAAMNVSWTGMEQDTQQILVRFNPPPEVASGEQPVEDLSLEELQAITRVAEAAFPLLIEAEEKLRRAFRKRL